MTWAGLVLDQGSETADTGRHPVHLGHGVAERAVRPAAASVGERGVDGAGVVAREEGEFDPDVPALVAGIGDERDKTGGKFPSP